MNFIKKILGILSPSQKRTLIWLQLLVLVVSIVELLGVASIAPFMAVAASPAVIHTNRFLNAIFEFGGFATDNSFLKFLGVVVLAVLFFGNLLIFLTNWLLTSFGVRLGAAISVNLYRHYLEKDYLFHTSVNSAILTKNIFHEVLRVTNNIIVQFMLMNSKVFTILFIGIGLLFINPGLTLIIGLILGGSYGGVYILTKRSLHENGAKSSRLLGKAFKAVSEGLSGIRDVKLHGKEEFYRTNFESVLEEYSLVSIFNAVVPTAPRYALEVLTFGGVIVTFIYFLSQGRNINDFLPILSLFAVAGLKLMPALQQVFASLTTIRANMNSFWIIAEDLNKLGDTHSNSAKVFPESPAAFATFNTLAVDSLSFKYSGSETLALANVSLSIPARTTCAFVGFSGSGKSTIVDLISGLIFPDSGAVKIDGMPLTSENASDWQREVGYVPQHVYLVDGSFKENIAFGERPEAIDIDRVRHSAKLARLDEFIEKSGNGYDTSVGERGVQLSGGQRQRIGIARALYRNPAVLIFDEATSALDGITESEIMDAIGSLSGQKTIILIAHRLTTVKYCDQVFLMDNGKLAATGSFQSLLNSSELFQEMAKK